MSMTISHTFHIALGCAGTLVFAWLTWRTIHTGMPAGNPKMNPRREERPIQFWLVVALYAGLTAWNAVQALSIYRA